MHRIITRRIVCIALLLWLLATTASAHGVRGFVNGLWFDGASFRPRPMWSVHGVLRDRWDGEVDETIDLGGGFVIPPFADAHHHDFGSAGRLEETIARYLGAGIFYVKNPNNIRSLTEPARETLNRPESVDVVWSNGGLTSPGGHPVQIYARVAEQIGRSPESMENDAWFAIDSVGDLERKWPLILEGKPDFIKAYLEHSEGFEKRRNDEAYFGRRGLDPSLLPKIVQRAHRDRLRVTVHIATAEDFRVAVRSGADEIAHLPLEKLPADDAALAAEKGVVVVTTTTSHRPADGIVDLDSIHRHNLGLLHSAGVKLAIGTDNHTLVFAEVDNLRRLGVFEPATLLHIWTMDTPATIFPDRRIGRLTDGYEASFLVLDGNPLKDFEAIRRVALRVKKGHVLRVGPAQAGPAAPAAKHP